MATYRFSLSLNEYCSNITFLFDIKTKAFIEIDRQFLAHLGVESTDWTLKEFSKYIFPEDNIHLTRTFNQVLTSNSECNIEFRLKINNKIKWIRLTPFKVKSDFGELILGNAEDITSKVNNMLTVQKYANKKNSVLNVLSHDLKGNLTVLKTISQVMAQKMQDEKFTKFTTAMSKVITQAVDLINDIITREIIESVSVDLVKERIDIVVKLKEYIEEFRRSEAQSHRKFKFNSSHQSIYLFLDESKFMQVLNNLMSNALKFTKNNGVISLEIEQQPNSVLFIFSDNGVGIPKAVQPRILEDIDDTYEPSLNVGLSIGLSLNVVKTIVEWHKGKIWFTSEVGKGTTFFIEIPKAQN